MPSTSRSFYWANWLKKYFPGSTIDMDDYTVDLASSAAVRVREVPDGDIDGVNDEFLISNLQYVSGSEDVYVNGALQKPTTDYTFVEGLITFVDTVPQVDDKVFVIYLTVSAGLLGTPVREVPTGTIDGVNDEFTLSDTPIEDSDDIFVNGALQIPGEDYTLADDTITFLGTVPQEGDSLYAKYRVE